MSIAFDLDIDDLLAFYKHYYKTDKRFMRTKRIRIIVFPILYTLLGLCLFDDPFGSDLYFFLLIVAFALFMPLFYMWYYSKHLLDKTRKNLLKPGNKMLFGARQLAVEEDGIRLTSDTVDEKIKWSGFLRSEEVRGYIFLYVAENMAHIIPLPKIAHDQAVELKTMINNYVPQKSAN